MHNNNLTVYEKVSQRKIFILMKRPREPKNTPAILLRSMHWCCLEEPVNAGLYAEWRVGPIQEEGQWAICHHLQLHVNAKIQHKLTLWRLCYSCTWIPIKFSMAYIQPSISLILDVISNHALIQSSFNGWGGSGITTILGCQFTSSQKATAKLMLYWTNCHSDIKREHQAEVLIWFKVLCLNGRDC